MGLYVNSVSELPLSESRSYYLYVLDYYGWDEPISKVLQDNSERIAAFCSANDAVMVKGLPHSHFYSEVLSWVKINGQGPNTILPALLITTIHPSYFIESDNVDPPREIDEAMIFVKIRDVCKAPGDVVVLLEKLFTDIKKHKSIKDFTIAQELRKGEHGAFVDTLILEPNFAGVGINIKKLVSWLAGKAKS